MPFAQSQQEVPAIYVVMATLHKESEEKTSQSSSANLTPRGYSKEQFGFVGRVPDQNQQKETSSRNSSNNDLIKLQVIGSPSKDSSDNEGEIQT